MSGSDRLPEDYATLRASASGRRRRGGGGARRWLMRAALAILIVGVVLPVGWVLLYRVVEAPGTLLMAQRASEGEDVRRRVMPISKISPHLVRAVIAAEDSRYCQHDGFDWEAIEAAAAFNKAQQQKGSDRRRGASTISQQTAKNLFLWPKRSWVRKGLEVYFTGLIEFVWPKRRIMEAYLNAAEWGDGLFGAEAAAQARFGKSAADLTPREAARLAAVLPSPNKWNAAKPGPYVRRRAAAIETRMRVVRSDGLAACVLGGTDSAPAPKKSPSKQPKAQPKPEPLPDLPEPPPELAPPAEGAPADTPPEPATESPPPEQPMEEASAPPDEPIF